MVSFGRVHPVCCRSSVAIAPFFPQLMPLSLVELCPGPAREHSRLALLATSASHRSPERL